MPLPSAKDLQKLAPQASLPTLELALTAYACASASQGGDNGLLTVIDYCGRRATSVSGYST